MIRTEFADRFADRAPLYWAALAAAWIATAPGPAAAQELQPGTPSTDPARPETPQNEPAGDPVTLEADSLTGDDPNQTITAEGNVEARYQGRILRADRVTYDLRAGTIHAEGNVQMVDRDGSVRYADQLEVDERLELGVATELQSRVGGTGRLAARTAIRRGERKSELSRVIYTSCPICEDGGRPPTWTLRARRAVQNTETRMISYQGAVLEVSGVPILYLPYFAHPDPSSGPTTGFLTPDLGSNRRLGVFYNQPYYWRISPHQDLTSSLEVHENVRPLGGLEYRKRFYTGDLNIQTSFTYDYDFDGEGNRIPLSEETARSHVFASGAFNINDYWNWGFGAERTSDDTYLQRYGIEGAGERRGPFIGDQLRLLSQIFTQGQDEQSYATVNFLSIQGLRTCTTQEEQTQGCTPDNPSLLPLVLPFGEFERVWREPIFDGQFKLHTSTAVLARSDDDVFTQDDPGSDTDLDLTNDSLDPDDDNDGIPDTEDDDDNNDGVDDDLDGVDDARVSVGASWRGEYVVGPGWVVSPFAEGRIDGYFVRDPQRPEEETFARPVGDIGVEVSWPFIRPGENVDLIVEPVAIGVIGWGDNDSRIVNIDNGGEDSIDFELDDSNLFRSTATPNYDLWETANRLSLGVRAAARAAGGQSANLLFGRRWRSEDDPIFDPATNLDGNASDWVGAVGVDLGPRFGAQVRARLEDESLEFSRLDATIRGSFGRFSAQTRYYSIDQAFVEPGEPARELTTNVGVQLVRGWELQYGLRRDLDQDINLSQNLRAIYRDDCTFLELSYSRNEITHGLLGPDEGFQIRVGLRSLGVFGGGD